jgi:hypothetical protein
MVYQFKLRLGERFSLVVQVSGGALTRTSSVASTIKIKSTFSRKLRVDTIFGAGLIALLFFFERCFQDDRKLNDGIVKSDRTKF